MLKLTNITKDYQVGEQKVHALKGLNISFRKNEFVSVLGPSGCGKTTLMNIIGGLDRSTSGELFINGKSTKNYKDSDWDNYRNKRIGFIFQNYNLIPHLTVLGNVEIALTISGASLEERKRRAKEALSKVGLDKQLNQKPNQLSGGQMQRVAIARALVNNPEILLADEPTGALDTENSNQIMDLIKEIAKDRLVIMVTHNPELAEKYSTRVIKMLDGNVIKDSLPYDSELEKQDNAKKSNLPKPKGKEKTAMSYLTALSLSWKNLITKKGRTILTAIAGSIGIIGIALILAISSGMNNYVNQLQRDTLASNPITITESSINLTQAFNAMSNNDVFENFPQAKEIYVEKAIDLSNLLTKNNITNEYITYLQNNLDSTWYSDITYKTGLELNLFGQKVNQTNYSKLAESSGTGGSGAGLGNFSTSSIWQMMLTSDFIQSQYDLLEGSFPTNKNQIVIIVSETNQISEATLIALGLKEVGDEVETYAFSDIIGKTYKLVNNDLLYEKSGNHFVEKSPLDIDYSQAETLEVVGVIRINETVDSGVLSPGIGYLKSLYTDFQTRNLNSEIIEFMNDNPTLNPFTGIAYENTLTETKEAQKEADYRSLGGELIANEISIYPTSFEAKESIKTILNDYNIGRPSDDMVTYTDMSELLGDTLTSVVNTISYVLIAFTAISLLVSSIMIAIITYVSVLERTKEIGVLRSIGARKKDITRVFNSETIIIGLIAGLVGVGFAYLLSIPINIIVHSLVGVNNIASLNPLAALALIGISVLLTLVSGLIPARKAAKQDPVTALRTE